MIKPQLSKKVIAIASSVIVIGAVTGVMALNNTPSTGATDVPPIVDQVNKQGDELANHEARISNTENDVKNLQSNTNTPPSTNRLSVPSASPASPSPSPNPAPTVVVTAYEKIPVNGSSDIDCKYTYSDGTTYQWHWQTAGADSWVTDGAGANGHWVPSTMTTGECNQKALGQPKG